MANTSTIRVRNEISGIEDELDDSYTLPQIVFRVRWE
jgi:hypothetical protein